jgi:hypothetical protein
VRLDCTGTIFDAKEMLMRRIVLVLAVVLLFLPACFYKPVYVDPLSVPSATRRAGMSTCHEVSRSRCAADQCRGANMDYVTLQCSGGRAVNRCVANLRCSAK